MGLLTQARERKEQDQQPQTGGLLSRARSKEQEQTRAITDPLGTRALISGATALNRRREEDQRKAITDPLGVRETMSKAKGTPPRGVIRTALEKTPQLFSAAKRGIQRFSESERERRAEQTFGEEAKTVLVDRPAQIAKTAFDFGRMIAGGLSEAGKSFQELGLTYGRAALTDETVGEANLRAQDIVEGTERQREIEQTLFGFQPDNIANLESSIRESLEKNPDAKEWEKKILPTIIPIFALGAELTPFGKGSGKLTRKVLKELAEDADVSSVQKKLIDSGVPEVVARRSAPQIARDTSPTAVQRTVSQEAKNVTRELADAPNQEAVERIARGEDVARGADETAQAGRAVDDTEIRGIAEDVKQGRFSTATRKIEETTSVRANDIDVDFENLATKEIDEITETLKRDINRVSREKRNQTLNAVRASVSPDEALNRLASQTDTTKKITDARVGDVVRINARSGTLRGRQIDDVPQSGEIVQFTDDAVTVRTSRGLLEVPRSARVSDDILNQYGFQDRGDFARFFRSEQPQARRATLGREGVRGTTPGRALQAGFRAGRQTERVAQQARRQEREILDQVRRNIEEALQTTQKKRAKAAQAIQDAIDGKSRKSIKAVQKEANDAGIPLDDETVSRMELGIADNILEKARGDVSKVIDRLKKAGISDETIDSLSIQQRYPLNKVVRIKREANGEISAVVDKSWLGEISRRYKGQAEAEKWIRTFSVENVKNNTKDTLGHFVVPQEWFRRTGLKEMVYDPVRMGERNAENLRREFERRIKDIFGELDPQTKLGKVRNKWNELQNRLRKTPTQTAKESRKRVFRYLFLKQNPKDGAARMRAAGVTPLKWTDLTKQEQRVIAKWRTFNRENKDQIFNLARNHGIDMGEVPDFYFPQYTRSDMKKVGHGSTVDNIGARNDPFFKSLKAREEDVPYHLYEEDALQNAIDWADGAARFLKVGERTLPLRYALNSEEFGRAVGKDVQRYILDRWLRQVTTPRQNAAVFKWLKRFAYISLLGLNPLTIVKQGISYTALTITQRTLNRTAQWTRKIDLPAVSERQPFIGLQDIKSAPDRAFLWGITAADKGFAGGALRKLLTKRINERVAQGEKMSTKMLRQELQKVSDDVDLAFGGATPAQRPPVYGSPIGEAILALASTVNSQLQFHFKYIAKGISDRDAKLLASATTAYIFSVYGEQAISRMDMGFEDTKHASEEMLNSAGGMIPVVGGMLFALQSGSTYQITPMLTTVNGVFKDVQNDDVNFFTAGEFFGLPQQIRKTTEGAKIVREGEVEIGNTTIPVRGWPEKVRALVRGKYGPLAVQEYLRDRDRFEMKNADDILSDRELQSFRAELRKALDDEDITPEEAEQYWNTLEQNQNQIKAEVLYEELKNESPEIQRERTAGLDEDVRGELESIVSEERRNRMIDLYNELKNESPEVQRSRTADLTPKEQEVIKEIHQEQKENRAERAKLLNQLRNMDVKDVDEQSVFERVSVYADAIDADFVQAFKLMFAGETIKRTDRGLIITERDPSVSQRVREERGATDEQELDHILPKQLGGTEDPSNLELVDKEKHNQYTRAGNNVRRAIVGNLVDTETGVKLFMEFRNGELTEDELYTQLSI